MTAFSTLYYKRPPRCQSSGFAAVRHTALHTVLAALRATVLVLGYWLLGAGSLIGTNAYAVDANPAEIAALRVERADDGLYLSATLNFELPSAVEEALLKGVPMTFVSEADVYRDRWYWYDKRVSVASRSIRIAYQPLTRRWRVNVASGTVASPATGIALTQHFDNLPDALATVRRIARWKIADNADVDIDARHNIEYSFKLDLSQLPRPLQIGVAGQSEWSINAVRNVRPELRTEPR
jgi:Domain of unknown function (DUF4390)